MRNFSCEMKKAALLVFITAIATPHGICGTEKPPLQVVVVGDLWEQAWIEHMLSRVTDIVQPTPWKNISIFEFEKYIETRRSARVESGKQCSTHGDPLTRLVVVTNMLFDEKLHEMLVGDLATHAQKPMSSLPHCRSISVDGLVVIDEYSNLQDWQALLFQFVVRVGFAHYPAVRQQFVPKIEPIKLWKQTNNTVVVPLGVPEHYPLPFGAINGTQDSSQRQRRFLSLNVGVAKHRRTSERVYLSAFMGRIQNGNRDKMIEGIARLYPAAASLLVDRKENVEDGGAQERKTSALLGDRHFVHDMGGASWMDGQKIALSVDRYAAVFADTVLAPNPPGNIHPECYRVYEALEAGALPIVDTDYFQTVFGAIDFLRVDAYWDIAAGIANLLEEDKAKGTAKGQELAVSSDNATTCAGKSWRGRALELILEGRVSGCSMPEQEELEHALMTAIEARRMRAVEWWERTKTRQVPRQVEGLIRYTENLRKSKKWRGQKEETERQRRRRQQQQQQQQQQQHQKMTKRPKRRPLMSHEAHDQFARTLSAALASANFGELNDKNYGDAVMLGLTSGSSLLLVKSLLRHTKRCAGSCEDKKVGSLRRIHLIARWSADEEDAFRAVNELSMEDLSMPQQPQEESVEADGWVNLQLKVERCSLLSRALQTQDEMNVGWMNLTETLLDLEAAVGEFDARDRIRFVCGRFKRASLRYHDKMPDLPKEVSRRARARSRLARRQRRLEALDKIRYASDAVVLKAAVEAEADVAALEEEERTKEAEEDMINLEAAKYIDYVPLVTVNADLFNAGALKLVHLAARPGGELEPDDDEALRSALLAWWPKLQPGGILAGSNYFFETPREHGRENGGFNPQLAITPRVKMALDGWVLEMLAMNKSSFHCNWPSGVSDDEDDADTSITACIRVTSNYNGMVDFAPSWWLQKPW